IYVVLTMRSDFLGDCARFHGLPEALNHSQYLIPQLTRAQRQEAIEGPLRVAGVSISPALVQRVLNEAGEEPDQLPVLQHALMRTFRLWKNRGGSGPIGVEDYDSAGCMAEALDRHASEVFEALPDDEHRLMTEKVFRCLTTVEKGRAVRRPTSLESIFGVTGASGARGQEVVRNVIRRFAAKENSFLLSSTAQDLGPGSIIDISHESLIAKWTLLGAWVMQEVKVVECYRYLSRDAALYPLAAGLWRDPELSYALEFFQSGECNDAWSRQYEESNTASYRETLQFLEESQRVQREENEREELRRKKEIEDARKLAAAEARAKRWLGGAALLLFLLLLTTGVVFWLYGASVRSREIERERVLLREQLSSAQSQANDARGRIASLEAAGGESAAELERLRRQVAQSEIEAKQAQAALRSSVPPSASAASPAPQQVDKRAESLISSLQEQLRVARQERDDAYGKLDAVAKGPLPGSEPSLDQDLESANRRVRYLESKLASARLGAAVLPENSLVPLTETPYRGRVAFLVGDLSAAGKAIPVRVLVAQSGMLPRGFEGDPKMASKYLGVAKVSCPGYAEVRGLTVYCFLLPTTVATRPEEIGRFWLDKEEVSLVALGLAQKPSGDYGKGSTVVSLVAFPAPQERALSKK
ncbi:MAG: hypothetical protein ACRD21_02635, partial [Vicinamibacteria bacterium]